MTYTDTHIHSPITIEGIEEFAIASYFATINQAEFDQTAALFIADGELHAPFEKPIIGRQAIASYLAQEAKGMRLLPHQGISEPVVDGLKPIKVSGKVKTSLFSVNVAWHFYLNQNQQITIAKIKLLASPQELLGLKKGVADLS
jgi:hypothetical protein